MRVIVYDIIILLYIYYIYTIDVYYIPYINKSNMLKVQHGLGGRGENEHYLFKEPELCGHCLLFVPFRWLYVSNREIENTKYYLLQF